MWRCATFVALTLALALSPFMNRGSPDVAGHNECYLRIYLISRTSAHSLLPPPLELPSPAAARRAAAGYGAEVEGADFEHWHPVTITFCEGSNIRDVITEFVIPPQEEVMVVVPVVYGGHEFNFLPGLFLNSSLGVLGGLNFGMRKHWYSMAVERAEGQKRMSSAGLFNVSFRHDSNKLPTTPDLVWRIWGGPLPSISMSYFGRLWCWHSELSEVTTFQATATTSLQWHPLAVAEEEPRQAVFVSYDFRITSPVDCEHYLQRPGG
eukprot:NODE_12304_length_1233_cov_4.316456.p1 GENE.NODE_12304_length_1233_cov_4.316456~~NODE_12304_length_1233_cov_4.316456.p1  ORF type:complete len:265 (+),score=53.16 NODE_12304_length_1233_cov_4.316456:72-866(+)